MAIELSKMSRKELQKLRTDVEKAIKDAETRDRKEAKRAAEMAAAEFGFSLSDLTTAAAKPKAAASAAAKYANPDNPSQTWTGKGRQPKWFKDALAAGTDPKALEV